MNVRTLGAGGVLLLSAVVAGCSSSPRDEAREDCSHAARCIYEGKYEPGEREYAEREAERLNQEATRKLRRAR